jgi:alpha-L-arabinofuranosidase
MNDVRVDVFADQNGPLVSPLMFGSFVEHLGRCVYGGLYDPGGPSADANGFRGDVIDLVKELGISLVRYPGGNFVSSYRWEDGVGPRESRPRRAELAWHSTETNEIGINEFATWLGEVGAEAMIVVNLGTRGVAAATELLEYCNHPGGTSLSDLRRQHGAEKAHGFRLWGLGNELDGPWQVGSKPPREYGALASATARAMKRVDPRISLVAAGSSNRQMSTFPLWDREVLEACYPDVDYLALHQYYRADGSDVASYLGSATDFDAYLDEAIATCDYVRALRREKKLLKLSVDEWNATHSNDGSDVHEPWALAPRLAEFSYTNLDAVVEASLLMALVRHAQRVEIACQSLLVNVGAPIHTEPATPASRTAIFFPLARMSAIKGGRLQPVEVHCPSSETSLYGPVPDVDAVCASDAKGINLHLFLLNRSPTEPAHVEVKVHGAGALSALEHEALYGLAPDRSHDGGLRPLSSPKQLEVQANSARLALAPASWHAFTLPLGGPRAAPGADATPGRLQEVRPRPV